MEQESNNNNSGNKLKKDYELSFLLTAQEDKDKVFEALRKYEAEIYHESTPRHTNLSYPIKKQLSAYFGFCYFTSLPDDVVKIEKELGSINSVLRFLIITPPIKQASSEEPRQETPEAKQARKQEPVLSNEALEQKLEEILK